MFQMSLEYQDPFSKNVTPLLSLGDRTVIFTFNSSCILHYFYNEEKLHSTPYRQCGGEWMTIQHLGHANPSFITELQVQLFIWNNNTNNAYRHSKYNKGRNFQLGLSLSFTDI